jgi:AcrR family transcriptional regulator
MVHSFQTTPRQQKREATGERIIEATMRALSRGGHDAVTMQGLASELGFAVGALYRYFPSKDAIIVAVQRRIIETLSVELAAAIARADAHVARASTLDKREAALLRLWFSVVVYEEMARLRPMELGLLGMTMGDPRQLVRDEDAGELVPALTALLAQVGSLLEAAAEVGALSAGDTLRRAVVLWTATQGALQLRKLERFEVRALSATAVLDEAVSALLVGWGADAEAVDTTRRRARQLAGKRA